MGMHGNQSGPVICEAVLTADRLVGDFGTSAQSVSTFQLHLRASKSTKWLYHWSYNYRVNFELHDIFSRSGEFPLAAHEVIDPYFLILSSSCWNGVALGCIDIAKNHVSQKQHVDMGMRVADYPIIQVWQWSGELLSCDLRISVEEVPGCRENGLKRAQFIETQDWT